MFLIFWVFLKKKNSSHIFTTGGTCEENGSHKKKISRHPEWSSSWSGSAFVPQVRFYGVERHNTSRAELSSVSLCWPSAMDTLMNEFSGKSSECGHWDICSKHKQQGYKNNTNQMDFTFYIYAQKSDNTLMVEIRSVAKMYLQSRVVFKNIIYL